MSQMTSSTAGPTFERRHRLGLALEWSGVSNQDMADEIGRGVTTIRNYLSGRTEPDRAVLVTWALRTGVQLSWLLDGEQASDRPDGGPGQVIDASGWFSGTPDLDLVAA